jgi:hypothetical protein
LEKSKQQLEEDVSSLKSDLSTTIKERDDLIAQCLSADHRIKTSKKDLSSLFSSTLTRVNSTISHSGYLRHKYSEIAFSPSALPAQFSSSSNEFSLSNAQNSVASQQAMVLSSVKDTEGLIGSLTQLILSLCSDLHTMQSTSDNLEMTLKSFQLSHAHEFHALEDRFKSLETAFKEEKSHRHRLSEEGNKRESDYQHLKQDLQF